MRKKNERLFTPEQELEICAYYWTRLPSGYYPAYREVAERFNCSAPLIKLILKRNNCKRRTNAETREGRPCKPINQPTGDAPLCACGCSTPVQWISKDSKWQKYATGHYSGIERKSVQPNYDPNGNRQRNKARRIVLARPATTRKTRQSINETLTAETLTELYCIKCHTIREIAVILDVGEKTVRDGIKTHGIKLRSLSETLTARGSVRGANNPAWKGGVADWDYSHDWKALSKKIKDRDQWTCQLCGEQRKRWGNSLHVHHIDEDKTNNHPHNLISLCSKCHHPIHGKDDIRQSLRRIAIDNTG